ncbi:MAG TPA: glutamate racemase [Gemmatimonadaceae bacterium]|nr:glutamate racemase [Gemmatimonadaceae bacterium]
MTTAPIGVFDSGLGGLTVVRALVARLPKESIIYVGDTARVPYGPKSPETVRRYSKEIAGYLAGEGVKAIVVACNTATAHALPELEASLSIPVVGVIEPGARAAVRATKNGPIGVIGTVGTIASGAYERAIADINPDITVMSAPCPLFVPLVEEGWYDTKATKQIVKTYLKPLAATGIDTLILGCTHYPLLVDRIAKRMGEEVTLIDSGAEAAVEVSRVLRQAKIEAPASASPTHRFIATDAPEQFLRSARGFLGPGHTIKRVETLNVT